MLILRMAEESRVQIILEFVDNATAALQSATSSASRSLDGLRSSAENMASGVISAVGNLGTTIGAAAAAIGIFGINEAANFQKLRIQLQAITGDTKEVDSIMGMLSKRATELPIDLPGAQRGVLQLRSLGVEGQRLENIFKATTAEIGVFGNVQNLSERLTLAFAQTLASQNMQAQEARQFMNANIPVYRILAEGIKEGTIQAKDLGGAFRKLGGAVGATAKQVATAKDTIKEANDHLVIQEQRLKELTATHAKTTTSTEKYTTQVKNLDSKVAKLNNNIAENQEWLKNAAGKNNVSTEAVMKHKNAISEAQKQIENLNSTLVSHTKTVKNVSQVNDTAKSTLMALNEQMDDNRAKITKAQSVVGSYSDANVIATASVDELASALREGLGDAKINSIQAVDAIAKWMINQFEPAMVAATNSFSGQVQIMKNNLKMLGSELVGVDVFGRETQGVFSMVTDALKGLNHVVLDARRFLQSFNGEGKAGIPIWVQLGVAFLGLMSIGPFLGMISPALGRFGTLGAVILVAAGAIGLMKQHWAEIEPYWDRLRDKLLILKPIWDRLVEVLQFLGQKAMGFLSEAVVILRQKLEEASPWIDKTFKWMVENKDYVVGAILAIAGAISLVLIGALANMVLATLSLAIPILLITAFVAALGVAVVWTIKHWDEIKLAFENAKNFIKEKLEVIGNFITVTIPTAMNNLVIQIGNGIKSIIDFFINLPGAIWNANYKFWTETLPYLYYYAIGWSAKNFPIFIGNLIGWFIQAGIGIINEISTWPGRFTTWIIKVGIDTINEVATWPRRIMGWLNTLPGKIVEWIGKLKESFTTGLRDIWDNSILTWGMKILDFFGNLIGKASEAISKMTEAGGKGYTTGWGKYQHGGIIPGPIGAAVPIMAHPGERIVPRTGADVGGMNTGGSSVVINISGSFTIDNEERIRQLANQISRVLGRQSELAKWGVGYGNF